MLRLIWVFAGRTLILLVLLCRGSFYFDRTIMSYRESRRFTETTLGFRDYGSARCAATWQNQQSDCAPSEDSDQPGYPPSLIRAFAVRMKKAWILSYPLSASDDSDQTGRMPRLIWVFARRIVILLVLSCRGSNILPFGTVGMEFYLSCL